MIHLALLATIIPPHGPALLGSRFMNAAIEGEQGSVAEIEFAMSRTPKKIIFFSFIFNSLFLFLNVFYFSRHKLEAALAPGEIWLTSNR